MRIFEASCEDGEVIYANARVPNCQILGEGGNSEGYLIIGEGTFVYVPKITPDTKSFLTLIEGLCTKLETLCENIALIKVVCAAPGVQSSVPVNSVDFTTASSEILAIHDDLTTLKNALK